jgi:hypothetical protein
MVAKTLGKVLKNIAQSLALDFAARYRYRGFLHAEIELLDILGVTACILKDFSRLLVSFRYVRNGREGFQAKDDVEAKGKCDQGHNRHETHAVASSYIHEIRR